MLPRPALACALLLSACLATGEAPAAPAPSSNAGKRGTYQADLKRFANYKYWVCVPTSYSDDKPAGLHLYFHGQGGHTGAPHFGQWQNDFLEPFNLIGINMQYLDGDNMKDTAGKVEAAQDAISQTMADYKVVLRGVVACFSGGGLPSGGLYAKVAAGPPTAQWPFNHACLYGSNYRTGLHNGFGMSWFIGLGGGEWTLANLGDTQTARMSDLLGLEAKGGTPDIHLRIEKEKGHAISAADVTAAAAQFHRSDLAAGRFLHEPSWTGKSRPLAALANSLQLGAAETAIAKILKVANLPEDERSRIDRLKLLVDARVEAILKLMPSLIADDAVLASWYGGIFSGQLKGHPRAKELKDLLAAAGKDPAARKQAQAREAFLKGWPGFLNGGGPQLQQPLKNAPLLTQIAELAGEKSLTGIMAREFLLLK